MHATVSRMNLLVNLIVEFANWCFLYVPAEKYGTKFQTSFLYVQAFKTWPISSQENTSHERVTFQFQSYQRLTLSSQSPKNDSGF